MSNTGEGKSKKTLEKELEDFEIIFNNLRPFIILALDEYYTGGKRDELESKLKDKGIEI